jgi:hypothetical protein
VNKKTWRSREREDYLEIFREWRKLEQERETESEEKGQP